MWRSSMGLPGRMCPVMMAALMGTLLAVLLVALLAVLAIGTVASAEAPEENFEWVPATEVVDYDVDVYPEEILTDWKTGDVYVLSRKYEAEGDPYKQAECYALERYDAETMSFEHVRDVPYAHIYEFAVYDGHVYMLVYYPGYTTFSVAIDNPAWSRSVDYTATGGQRVESTTYTIEDLNSTHMKVLSEIDYRTSGGDDYKRFELVTIDLSDYSTERDNVMSGIPEFGYYTHIRRRGDVLYVFYDDANYPDFKVYWFLYDLGEGRILEHEAFDHLHMEAMYYPWDVIMDVDGSFHLWFPDQGPLVRKYDVDGDHLSTMDLTGLIDSPTVPAFGMLPLMCNGSGDLYIVYYNRLSTYIRAMVISSNYGGYTYVNVTEGDFEAHSLIGRVIDDDRIMLVWTAAHGDISELMFTHQVPLTPDLEVDPSSFSFLDDHEHEDERIDLSVRNVGKARATFYRVSVVCVFGEGGGAFLIGNGTGDAGLPMGGSEHWRFPTDLPGGAYRVQVTVHSVGPLEIWTDNNVFEMWIFVRNKAPELQVLWPHDGTFVDDELRFSGRTFDKEDPDGVITVIDIPGIYPLYVNGSGYWNLTVDTSGLSSGGYGLTIYATDLELTTTVQLKVWVDHPEETFTIEHFSPEGDVDLIVGESQAFEFIAKDLFLRPIEYAWTIDGEAVAGNVPSFLLSARTAGVSVLRAEATNTYRTVYREWNVTVRDPIAPSIVGPQPIGDLTVPKGDTVDFVISVENPDQRTYSLLWTLDGVDLGGPDPLERSVGFDLSGDHYVRVTLVSQEGVSWEQWTVTVENRAPVVVGREPSTDTIVISEVTEMTFSAECEDPDLDDLTYSWHSPALGPIGLAGPEVTLLLPCDDDAQYQIILRVSDGEDDVLVEWTVAPDPPAPPVNRAPVLSSIAPTDDPIVIEEDTVIAFLVTAVDPDGDPISYEWGSSKLAMDARDESGYSIECPCSGREEYTVWVTVSDGEHDVKAEWTVTAQPREDPVDLHNGDVPVVLIAVLVAAACVVAMSYMWWHRGNDLGGDHGDHP